MNEKYIIPVCIIVASLIIGFSLYTVQTNKQKSIERQQQLALEQKDKELKEERKKEGKSECLKIYQTEDKKWNNVRGWRYDAEEERCYIRYKDPTPKTAEQCDKLYPKTLTGIYWIMSNLICKDGEFENLF